MYLDGHILDSIELAPHNLNERRLAHFEISIYDTAPGSEQDMQSGSGYQLLRCLGQQLEYDGNATVSTSTADRICLLLYYECFLGASHSNNTMAALHCFDVFTTLLHCAMPGMETRCICMRNWPLLCLWKFFFNMVYTS